VQRCKKKLIKKKFEYKKYKKEDINKKLLTKTFYKNFKKTKNGELQNKSRI